MQGRRPGHSRSEAQPAGGGHDTVYPKYLSLLFLSISDCNTSLPDIFMLCIVHDLCMPSYHSCCYFSRIPDFLWVQCICDPLRHGSQHILYAQTRLIPSLGWQDIFILATIMYASTSKSEYFVTLLSANV